jgi:hypothetical protein
MQEDLSTKDSRADEIRGAGHGEEKEQKGRREWLCKLSRRHVLQMD